MRTTKAIHPRNNRPPRAKAQASHTEVLRARPTLSYEEPSDTSEVNESRRQKFVRLFGGRSDSLIGQATNLCKLADRDYYDYTPEDIAEIAAFADRVADLIKRSFQSGRETGGGLHLPLHRGSTKPSDPIE